MDADVLVVGGGHAGIEASHIAAVLGLKTVLLSLSKTMIGNTPCNPHIGGSAKGIVAREIDALGGLMGLLADHDPLQVKMLNTAKGPGVQCLRAQVDKLGYPKYAQEVLGKIENLTIVEGEAKSLIHEGGKVLGVLLEDGSQIRAKATILTTGTYMDSTIIRGEENYKEGPDGGKASLGLSESLREMGLRTFRLKTGTPPRIKNSTIDYSKAEIEPGMEGYYNFSFLSEGYRKLEGQLPCYLIHTSEKTLQIIRENIEKSALYNGSITSVGPRYCPAIESKVMRFSDKPRHQLFLEPEIRGSESIYLQGFSTGFPRYIQDELVHSLPGLEKAEILKYAYQIEYDCLDSLEFLPTLEHKHYQGLYCAGQILGTSGYEEAGALGLMAGINASLKILGKPPFILRRDEAYIGVMIDDLLTKGTEEPYRLLSSRAEYRLLLRHDNAAKRLTPKAIAIKTASKERIEKFNLSEERIKKAKDILLSTTLNSKTGLDDILTEAGYEITGEGVNALALLKRPRVTYKMVESKIPFLQELRLLGNDVLTLETETKFEGYIERAKKEAEKLKKLEDVSLPSDLDYLSLKGLRLEAREKLSKVRPLTLGQASRIPGVNPADCAILALHLKKKG